MLGGFKGRHPLLPAKHAKRQQRRPGRRAAADSRRSGALLAALAVLAVATVLLYRFAPRTPAGNDGAASEEAVRDSDRELQLLLHEAPSEQFCSLPPPLICAHGGDIDAAPPNTAAAFLAALDGGARCIEVDVARTRDGQLAVLHTRELAHLLKLAGHRYTAAGSEAATAGWFRRWWGASGSGHVSSGPHHAAAAPQVGDFTWAQLSRLRWEGGHRIELAESVVRMAVQRGAQQVTLDVKTHSQAGEDVEVDSLAQAVVDLVARTACRQCLVWAKSDEVVRLVKELEPSQRVGYVVLNETAAARVAGMHRLLRLEGAEVVALHYAMASDAAVTQSARAAAKQVHAWTANTPGMMKAVLDAGVDAVVTNHPRRLQAAVDSRHARCSRGGMSAGAVGGLHQLGRQGARQLAEKQQHGSQQQQRDQQKQQRQQWRQQQGDPG